MHSPALSPRSRVALAMPCLVLLVVLALVAALPAQGQDRSRGNVPSELWKTYPLDPSKGRERIQPGTGQQQEQVSPPAAGSTDSSPGTENREVQQQPSP
ncbi:MAG: hypothetical protein M3327_04940, partial [Actinomycetota bacterium]|nr:hypothetical protein [Actinomycetota bacterium]